MKLASDSAKVWPPPPLVFLAGLGLGLFIDYNSDLPGLGLDYGLRNLLGALLLACGAGLLLWAAGLFRRAGTDVKPWMPTTSIVTSGAYRISRNPMYLGMALIFAAIAIRFDGLAALLCLLPVLAWVRTQVIAKEERYLTAKFGEAYLAYCRKVRRWI